MTPGEGIHHTAFEFETFDQWLDNYVRLRDHQTLPFLTLDHGEIPQDIFLPELY